MSQFLNLILSYRNLTNKRDIYFQKKVGLFLHFYFWRKMKAFGCKKMLSIWVLICCYLWLMVFFTASGNVVLIQNNVTLSFADVEAGFAPSVKKPGIQGTLYLAEPLDACSVLTNNIVRNSNDTKSPFVLVIRGGCDFDGKVRQAQDAGFEAVIVYDTEDKDLVPMYGDSAGIKINAVFVSRASGETLAKYAGASDMELWIVPSFEKSLDYMLTVSFLSVVSIITLVAACLFIQKFNIREERIQALGAREVHGMSGRLVRAMPILTFTADLEDNSTSGTCAICLDEYDVGEKLRILPCSHKFHAICVDDWLTSWRTFCPICKRDARASSEEPPASESTPLLSRASSAVLSSQRSSSAIQIGQSPHHYSPLVSRPKSITGIRHPGHSHNQPPYLSKSWSCLDVINMSSESFCGASLVPPRTLGYPTISSLNSRSVSMHSPSQGNALSSSIGSSSRQPSSLYCSESSSSFSAFKSAQSLPE